MLTFSVLMSVYKSEAAKSLDRALCSVWTDQSLKPQEIILVKDGPLGEELERIIEIWKSEIGDRLRIISNEINIGLTKSLNKGLNIVDTDLIARMDSDDVSLPNRFELQTNFLEKNKDVDIVGGAVEIADAEGNVKYIRYFPFDHETAIKTIHKKSPLSHPAVMIRANILKEKNLKYDERYRNSQDIVFWFDAIAAGCKLANIKEPVLRFTETEDVYTRRGKVRAKNEFLAFSRGIKKIYGPFTMKQIYPMMRYLIRCMPPKLIRVLYNSRVYKSIYQKG